MNKPAQWINVDEWMAEQTLKSAADACGHGPLEVTGSGKNERIDCPFNCEGDHASKREIAVDTESPGKVWKCHAYGCDCRGNLLNLMYGWLHGRRWTGEKLRGSEFKEVRQVIAGEKPAGTPPLNSAEKTTETITEAKENPPLLADERTKALMEPPLWEKLVTDVAAMSPEASAYVRRHPCLSSAEMKKWGVGYMRKDGGGDKRGWSLRDHVIYPFRNENGEVIAFVGRDPKHEEKLRAFAATPAEKRDAGQRPVKHRFPKEFHRGIELFGQERGRLEEAKNRAAVRRYGLILVEGFNDVIHLDSLQIPAVAICSNRLSDEQVDKVVRLAMNFGDGRVRLMFDCDREGDEGAKEAAWKLLMAGLDVRPVWSGSMHGGIHAGKQPEGITDVEADELLT